MRLGARIPTDAYSSGPSLLQTAYDKYKDWVQESFQNGVEQAYRLLSQLIKAKGATTKTDEV